MEIIRLSEIIEPFMLADDTERVVELIRGESIETRRNLLSWAVSVESLGVAEALYPTSMIDICQLVTIAVSKSKLKSLDWIFSKRADPEGENLRFDAVEYASRKGLATVIEHLLPTLPAGGLSDYLLFAVSGRYTECVKLLLPRSSEDYVLHQLDDDGDEEGLAYFLSLLESRKLLDKHGVEEKRQMQRGL